MIKNNFVFSQGDSFIPGRGTGFPTIYNSMEVNGSPAPVFNTDEQTYVLVTLPVHHLANDQVGDQAERQVNHLIFNSLNDIVAFGNQANDQANDQAKRILDDAVHDKVMPLLNILDHPLKRAEIFAKLGLRNHSDTRKRYIDPMLQYGWIEMTAPESPAHPNQKYKITASGIRILNLISQE